MGQQANGPVSDIKKKNARSYILSMIITLYLQIYMIQVQMVIHMKGLIAYHQTFEKS